MASKKKAIIRKNFNYEVMFRDGYACVLCKPGKSPDANELEVHHITNRKQMPNGGYVKENGITLCGFHHRLCEADFYYPTELYNKIDSSFFDALAADSEL